MNFNYIIVEDNLGALQNFQTALKPHANFKENEIALPETNVEINTNGNKNITVSFSKDKQFDKYFWQDGLTFINQNQKELDIIVKKIIKNQ